MEEPAIHVEDPVPVKRSSVCAKDRMKAYRERIRANLTHYELKKGTDKERKRHARLQQKINILKLTPTAQKRLKTRERFLESERKRKLRQKISEKSTGGEEAAPLLTPSKIYKTRQAAGKAMQRLRVRLPFSPRKRRAVTLQLALESGNSLSLNSAKQNSKKSVSQEVIDKVSEFYCSDDISWAAPGLRDGSIIKENERKKTVIQKRYLTMNIMEAYQLFKIENSQVQLGKSRFFDFRPKHVKIMADIPHNVCICKIHGNIDSLLQGLSKAFPECPHAGRSLIDDLVCDRMSDKCMLGLCLICGNNKFVLNLGNHDDSEDELSIKWRRWEDVMGRPAQIDVSLSPADAIAQINFLLPEYKTHCLIKDEQSNLFRQSKTDIEPRCAILQIDFAENYAATCQDEVQSAHWNHQQVTVFTAVAWLQTSCQSFTVVSDDTDHDKVAVWAMLKVIIQSLKEEHSVVNVKIFSDGCAAQFKNRYTMANLCFMAEDFNVHCEWAFFASSHGKGSVDAVGGTVKRSVWRAVKGRKVIVNNAETFYKVAAEQCKQIKVMFLPSVDIRANSDFLESRWKRALPIPAIQKQHNFKPTGIHELYVSRYASESPVTKCKVLLSDIGEDVDEDQITQQAVSPPAPVLSVAMGDWVLVKYDNSTFPGEVKAVQNQEVKVSVMVPSGSGFKWPMKEDCILYKMENVIQKLHPPAPHFTTSSRGTFVFAEIAKQL